MKNECYLDNELVLSSVPQAMPLQFVASGYDEEKGELVIKVVNGADTAYLTTIQIKDRKHSRGGKGHFFDCGRRQRGKFLRRTPKDLSEGDCIQRIRT